MKLLPKVVNNPIEMCVNASSKQDDNMTIMKVWLYICPDNSTCINICGISRLGYCIKCCIFTTLT